MARRRATDVVSAVTDAMGMLGLKREAGSDLDLNESIDRPIPATSVVERRRGAPVFGKRASEVVEVSDALAQARE